MSSGSFVNAQNRPEWLDLRSVQQYATISERTLRAWIHHLIEPLPAVRVGGKVLVRRSDFDNWLRKHSIKNADVSEIVEKILAEVKAS
jgi:excisionase family DNA binding protein